MIKMVRNVSHDSTLTSFVCLIFGPCAVLGSFGGQTRHGALVKLIAF